MVYSRYVSIAYAIQRETWPVKRENELPLSEAEITSKGTWSRMMSPPGLQIYLLLLV